MLNVVGGVGCIADGNKDLSSHSVGEQFGTP